VDDFYVINEIPDRQATLKTVQKPVKVTATQTIYNFVCREVSLDVTFTGSIRIWQHSLEIIFPDL